MDMQTVGEETKLKRACTCSVERLAAKTESLQRDFNPSLLKLTAKPSVGFYMIVSARLVTTPRT